nr:RNA-directed DNA polymerase, eukaryota [Tanacetum cinerariifolium]
LFGKIKKYQMLRGRIYKKSPSNSQNSSDTRKSPLSRGRKLIRAIPLHKPSRLQPNKIPDPNVLSESPTGSLTKCGSNQLLILCHFPYLCMHEQVSRSSVRGFQWRCPASEVSGGGGVSVCLMMVRDEEDIHHVLFRCEVVTAVMRRVCRWWTLDWQPWSSFSDWNAWFSNVCHYRCNRLFTWETWLKNPYLISL